MKTVRELIDCPVCGVQTDRKKRCGAYVCDACKRFFLRNRTKHELLRCERGSDSCYQNSNVLHGQKMNWFGSVLRQICSKCRYDRCVFLGMGKQMEDRVDKILKSEASSSIVPRNANVDVTAINPVGEMFQEQVLNGVIVSLRKITRTIRPPVPYSAMFNVNDETSFWKYVGLPLFEFHVSKIGDYVKSLPGYNALKIPDRIVLFINSYSSLIYAFASTLDGHVADYADMLLKCSRFACQSLGDYDYCHMMKIRKIAREWQPCLAEWAIFMSLLFFNDRDPRIIDPTPVRITAMRLRHTHRALLMNRLGNDMDAVEDHERKMEEMLRLVEEAAIGRIIPLREAIHRNWRALSMSNFLGEFFGIGKHRPELKHQRSKLMNLPEKLPWD